MRKITNQGAYFSIILLVSCFVTPIFSINTANAESPTSVVSMYVDQPFVQGSYATSYGGVTETFDDFSTPNPVNYYYQGTQFAVGDVTSGSFIIGQGGYPYGSMTTDSAPAVNGVTSKFSAALDDSGFTITFAHPMKYVGFWWASGNMGNEVTLYSNGSKVTSMNTDQLWNLLGHVPTNTEYPTNNATVSSISENQYLKKYYFGNPGYRTSLEPTEQSSADSQPGEPFAYIHAFANNGLKFDQIKFSGAGFEFDNITVSQQDVPVSNSLVFLSDIEPNCNQASYDNGDGSTTIRFTGTFCLFNPPAGVSRVSIVIAGGGGGGGGGCLDGYGGGGGGGGGFLQKDNQVVTGPIQMAIGIGGLNGYEGDCSSSVGHDGGNTTVTIGSNVMSALGGGGGGAWDPYAGYNGGRDGASGGGGSGDVNQVSNSGGIGSNNQGSSGGMGFGTDTVVNPGGGGGGYSESGFDGYVSQPWDGSQTGYGGDGGNGIELSLFGTTLYFSGGGGGSSTVFKGFGGGNCGGDGAEPYYNASALSATGYGCGGGGGANGYGSSSGSDGVVFISYNVQVVTEVNSCAGAGSLINGDFENLPSGIQEETEWWRYEPGYWHGYTGSASNDPRQILFLYDQSDPDSTHGPLQLSGWNTSEGDHNLEIQRQVSGYAQDGTQTGGGYVDFFNGAPASGNYYAELNANEASTLYQIIPTIPGTTIRWSLKHRGRWFSWDAVDTMHVRIGVDIETAEVQTGDPGNGNVEKFSSIPGSEYSTPVFSSTPTQVDASGSMSDSLDSGWSLYTGRYQVPAGQTQTLFAFQSDDGPSSIGNYLDDIQFTPLIACPASITVVAGRTTTVNPFDVNANGNALAHDSEDSYGWSNAFVSSVSSSDGTVTRTSLGGVANRGFRYSAPSAPGTYSINFMIGNPQGDLSRSHYEVTVLPNPKLRAPSDIPVDPRTENLTFGLSQVTTANSDVLACFQQSDSLGVTFNGSLRFDAGIAGVIDDVISTPNGDVTVSSDRTNYLILRGSLTAINSALRSLNLYRSGASPRLGSTFYIKLSSVVTGLPLYDQSNCGDARSSQIKIIRIRPIKLTQTRSFTILPKNGRQNN